MPDDSDELGERPRPQPGPSASDETAQLPPDDGSGTVPVWRIGDRYRVIARIGSGGMADVLRAQDELLQRDVAVKVFRTPISAPDTAAGTERQRAELHALARLNHPHLITLFDGSLGDGAAGGPAYLVMELIEGPTLADRIRRGPLPEHEIRVIGRQVADALAYVHEAGMVHRDVKPANILLGVGGMVDQAPVRARLSDFGIVRLLGADRLTSVDATLGTASYLAPEQARGSGVGPPADVYALGLTLLEAFTGVRAFEGATPIEAAVARLERDPQIPAQLPAPWPGLLAAMTARDPAARPTAGQVAQALRNPAEATTKFLRPGAAAVGGTAVLPAPRAYAPPPPPVSRPASPPPPPKSHTSLWVGAVLVLVLLALGVAILLATTSGNNSPGPSSPPSPTKSTATKSTPPRSSSPSSPPSSQPPPSSSRPAQSTPRSSSPSPSSSASSSSRSSSSSASPTPSRTSPSAPTSSSTSP